MQEAVQARQRPNEDPVCQKPRQHTSEKADFGKLLISVVYLETYNLFARPGKLMAKIVNIQSISSLRQMKF